MRPSVLAYPWESYLGQLGRGVFVEGVEGGVLADPSCWEREPCRAVGAFLAWGICFAVVDREL